MYLEESHWIYYMDNSTSLYKSLPPSLHTSRGIWNTQHTVCGISSFPAHRSQCLFCQSSYHFRFHILISLWPPRCCFCAGNRWNTFMEATDLNVIPTWKQMWNDGSNTRTLASIDRKQRISSHCMICVSVFTETMYKNSIFNRFDLSPQDTQTNSLRHLTC